MRSSSSSSEMARARISFWDKLSKSRNVGVSCWRGRRWAKYLTQSSRAGNLVAVGQGFQECNDIILFLVRQLKIAELLLVEVRRIFRGRPACDLFTGISGIALGQHVAGVVEMHHLFEALEIAVVHVSLHEVGRGAHVDIAQRGDLELGVEFRSKANPLRVWIQLAAIALQRAQERSDACVDKG